MATKGCTSDGAPAITFIQHTPAPGLVAVSYSNYCEDSFCNNKEDLHELWRTEEIDGTLGGERWVLRETPYSPEKTGLPLLRSKCAIHKRTSDLWLVFLFLNCYLEVWKHCSEQSDIGEVWSVNGVWGLLSNVSGGV